MLPMMIFKRILLMLGSRYAGTTTTTAVSYKEIALKIASSIKLANLSSNCVFEAENVPERVSLCAIGGR